DPHTAPRAAREVRALAVDVAQLDVAPLAEREVRARQAHVREAAARHTQATPAHFREIDAVDVEAAQRSSTPFHEQGELFAIHDLRHSPSSNARGLQPESGALIPPASSASGWRARARRSSRWRATARRRRGLLRADRRTRGPPTRSSPPSDPLCAPAGYARSRGRIEPAAWRIHPARSRSRRRPRNPPA